MARSPILFAALAAAILSAAPALAQSVGVSRCDRQEGAVFQPGLMTVDAAGTRVFHPVGENGLTESIVFNRDEAFAWVAGQGLFPAGTVFGDYDGYICGLPCEECAPEEEAEPQENHNGTTEDAD
ncbi:hypothetical protein [Roseicyclus sp.]|uniref:hypothetical protein n=1 Tax=Roseicyclus sp. TaxID=1914329 RepID=UPI003F9FB2F6